MTTARVEFIHIGDGLRTDGTADHVLRQVVASLAPITVTTTATTAGARPVVPEGDAGRLYARVTALGGNVIVAWGADPTASATGADRILIASGAVDIVPVTPGQKLSFLEVA